MLGTLLGELLFKQDAGDREPLSSDKNAGDREISSTRKMWLQLSQKQGRKQTSTAAFLNFDGGMFKL